MTAAQQKMSVEQYLAAEERSQERHEYVAGEVYAMVGASRHHNKIAGNLFVALATKLRDKPCDVFMSDMKLRVEKASSFFYPDLFVSCGDTRPQGNAPYATDAQVVIEVLSESTSHHDHTDKLNAYRKLGSLKEYVLVSQERRFVEVYRRSEVGWSHTTLEGNDMLRLESLNFEILLAALYHDTDVA